MPTRVPGHLLAPTNQIRISVFWVRRGRKRKALLRGMACPECNGLGSVDVGLPVPITCMTCYPPDEDQP